MRKFLIIFFLIILFVLIFFVIYDNKKIHFSDYSKLSYADENDEYYKPFIVENLLEKKLCQQIINQSKSHLIESEIITGKNKNIRNSMQYWINKNDPIIKPLFDKICSIFNIPLDNAEYLQVVRYLPNQYFNEHHDSCCDNTDKCIEFISRGGQRKLTVLIYLNNEFTGGETFFPNLRKKYKPKTGSAIIFSPLAINSFKCHPYALHAGLPVLTGEKWIANLWFRENKFN